MVKRGVVACAGAAGTVLSSLIYLFDFITTLITLHEYYIYEYECPHAPLSSPLLLHNPVCSAIRSSIHFRHYPMFWVLLVLLLLAHLCNTIIFWCTLPPSQHPLRLAYFMPLIHLHRLFKVLFHSFSITRLQELQKSQMELNSLYNAVGVALEIAPQFVIQMAIAFSLGQYIKESAIVGDQAQKIPVILLLSLIASIISGTYGASMATLCLFDKQVPLSRRGFISIMMGMQTFVAILAKGINYTVLHQGVMVVNLYGGIGILLAWLFSRLVVHNHYRNCRLKSTWIKFAHTLGLAFMIRIVGPVYVLIKLGTSLGLFVWGTIVHILAEMTPYLFVYFWPNGIESPCSTSNRASLENKYFKCELYLGVTFSCQFVFILTTSLIVWVYMKNDKNVSLLPTNLNQSIQHESRQLIKIPFGAIQYKGFGVSQ
ncbi:hypothetical protein GOP47_0003719 [Adiantum capillus-veneris]|uniref:Uncharacterized protein n=1 Tax=Adiantum capillus-veneris TaxID=13818 RepID=A0A9D4V658_ADICA|nr:hypothetical protein GOP47_0003719 [Adiantum capillus-veneris]